MSKASRHVEPYPPEFREEAVRLARTSGKSHRQIADDVGMTSEKLRLCLKQADLTGGAAHAPRELGRVPSAPSRAHAHGTAQSSRHVGA